MPARRGFSAGRIALYAVLVGICLLCLGPLAWAVSSSFKPAGDIFQYPPRLIPDPATLANFVELITQHPFGGWLRTSLIIAAIGSAVSVFVCSLAGYAFAMFTFRGKGLLFSVMISSLAIPFMVVAIPLFVMLYRLGLNNAYFVMVVPWVAPAFGIFMMRQYTEQSIPDELLEAARVDGCGEFRIFLTIVFPLLRPGAGALAVWSFVHSYNSFLWPLIVIENPADFTLPLGIQALFGAQNHQYNLVMAGAVLATLPAVIIFIALRKQLIVGLTAGSVKG
jgi:ABC-type glycerol-3-phosphate transport system permease component